MTGERIHRARSADGTRIAGRFRGQGRPVVLVHGAPHDGDLAWEALVPRLADRFACFLPSLRGRGLSEDGADHSPPRLYEDVRAFVESIGERVFLVGWSAGVAWSLPAAENGSAVAAVAAYEPTIVPLMRGEDSVRRDAAYQGMAAAAGDDRPADAARVFHRLVGTADELDALGARYFERCAACMPALLRAGRDAATYRGPVSTEPQELAKVTVPVLLLRGERTRLDGFYADTVRHVAEHVAEPVVRRPLPGLGHWAPLLEPGPIAEELEHFFGSAPETPSTGPGTPDGSGRSGSADDRRYPPA
jgi:hypothetical protein